MKYKYNELVYAELIYNNGFQTKYIPTELRLLVLYFRDVLGLKPKEREYEIYKFCQEKIPNFKREKFYKTINKALKVGLKKEQKLIVVSKIDIYKSELNYINSLEINQEYKKVMFTFLVQLKLNKIVYEYKYDKKYNMLYFKGGLKKYNNIKKISNIPIKMSLNDEVINILSNLKLITIIHKGIICLDYIKNCIEDEDVLITITDFENIGLYLDYNNHIDGVITCENCNKIIKVKNNKQKYCKDCAKEVKSQQDRIADKKYKQKLKSEKIENPENA